MHSDTNLKRKKEKKGKKRKTTDPCCTNNEQMWFKQKQNQMYPLPYLIQRVKNHPVSQDHLDLNTV